ncbi:hypothetical protein FA95DRAFT_1567837 [Auriscalpium vulgare]|uniref:Uncharacterized protein n=1 Tax=Auriscalpium vulgare TaxID=40419 RepID=A0ACB8R414_9AGAM|nr:hypothetical protein FA95DRAFT_1567837 [Auriscalpium vulgare]
MRTDSKMNQFNVRRPLRLVEQSTLDVIVLVFSRSREDPVLLGRRPNIVQTPLVQPFPAPVLSTYDGVQKQEAGDLCCWCDPVTTQILNSKTYAQVAEDHDWDSADCEDSEEVTLASQSLKRPATTRAKSLFTSRIAPESLNQIRRILLCSWQVKLSLERRRKTRRPVL